MAALAGSHGSREAERGGGSGATKEEASKRDHRAASPFAAFPKALGTAPGPLPPPVGISPAGSRSWLLAGESSEEEGEVTSSPTSSGKSAANYLKSTASIDVDDCLPDSSRRRDRRKKREYTLKKSPQSQNFENRNGNVERGIETGKNGDKFISNKKKEYKSL